MEYFKSKLENMLIYKILKIVKKNKKLLVLVYIFPGELNYNERSIYYFQGFQNL